MDSCNFHKQCACGKTRDHWPWMIMLEHRCWKQEQWSSIVIWSLSDLCPCVSSCCCRLRNEGLPSRKPDITLGHIHIPPLTGFSREFLYCLAWMQESAAAGVCPDNIVLKLQKFSVLHLFMHAAEWGDWTFSIYNAPWVSRLQVITVKCWICCWGEHYNHVFPDKAVLKQTKSYPLPSSPHRPRSLIELISMQMLCF